MKKIFVIIFVLVLLSNFAYSQELPIDRLKNDVKFLSSDELEGRYPGTATFEIASKFIEDRLKSLGAKPINNSYRNEFEYVSKLVLNEASNFSLNVIIPKPGIPIDKIRPRVNKLVNNSDWLPHGISGTGIVSGQLAFVGFGISDEKLKYDDYVGIDVKDKIVLAIVGTPDGDKKDGAFYGRYGFSSKVSNAKSHGAKAIIFVKPQGDSANVFNEMQYFGMNSNDFIALQVNRTTISKYFPNTAELFPTEKEIMQTKKPKSFILPNITVDLDVKIDQIKSKTSNILGFIEGTDPNFKDDYIVIGAHYDHLGFGNQSSQSTKKEKAIHNGADDNASGVAGILELALRVSKEKLKHPVLFVGFSCEEMGLLGSKAFCDNPPIQLNKTLSMLNLDMIGGLKDDKLIIYGTGSASELNSLVDTEFGTSFKLTKMPTGNGPSDNASFFKKDVPVLHFFTNTNSLYHTPQDDWDKLNYSGMDNIVNKIESLLRKLDLSSKVVFTKVN
ncbi:MAG: M20/M25/M40 family metallo-hydrolase [Candidatus Kapabacteria bacterium]|nr:M20/M25/M40 family metallo-hydrolase [Candidatus Kapabacteria bacterium]